MTDDEIRASLRVLFSQFGTADGDMEGKLVGYLIALEDATGPALKAAVRRYIRGEVEGHDGRFIPTSAELARVVRREQAQLDRITPRRLRLVESEPPPEVRERMVHRFKDLSSELATTISMDQPRPVQPRGIR